MGTAEDCAGDCGLAGEDDCADVCAVVARRCLFDRSPCLIFLDDVDGAVPFFDDFLVLLHIV